MDEHTTAGITTWETIANRLSCVLEEPETEIRKRREWLVKYLNGGGDVTHMAAGAALAGAILTAAVLNAGNDVVDCLVNHCNRSQGRDCFRHDFARCLIVRLHRMILADDLAWGAAALAGAPAAKALDMLLLNLAHEAGGFMREISCESEALHCRAAFAPGPL